MTYSETRWIYLWTEMNIYFQSLNWTIFGQNIVRQCKCPVLEPQLGEVKLRCTLVYLPMSYSETKAIYLWAEMNIYSQSLNWTIFGQNVVRQCKCHILEDRSGEVKFRCTLVYLPMSYSETKAIYLWAEMNIYSQSLNWTIFGQNVVRQCKCHILEHSLQLGKPTSLLFLHICHLCSSPYFHINGWYVLSMMVYIVWIPSSVDCQPLGYTWCY